MQDKQSLSNLSIITWWKSSVRYVQILSIIGGRRTEIFNGVFVSCLTLKSLYSFQECEICYTDGNYSPRGILWTCIEQAMLFLFNLVVLKFVAVMFSGF